MTHKMNHELRDELNARTITETELRKTLAEALNDLATRAEVERLEGLCTLRDATERECAKLTAALERSQTSYWNLSRSMKRTQEERDAADSSLANANALLKLVQFARPEAQLGREVLSAIDAHLAAQPATAVRPPNPEAVARILADPDCEAPTRTEVCDECGTIHGPANTNTLCSSSSNYRGLGHSAWRNRDTRTEDDLGRTDHPEATDDLAGALACLSVWEPDARVIGNVRAATLRALLQSVAARRPERWVR